MTDEELSIKAQSGDETALNTLLTKYKSLINKVSRSYFLIGGDMEDLIQEGMIGLYKAIMNYSDKRNTSFKTFANTCIKNQIQTAVKIASSEKNKVLSSALPIMEEKNDDEEEEMEIIIPSSIPSPDFTIVEKESFKEIFEEIKQNLSNLEFKVLLLYLRGFSYNEISKTLNIPKKSIDNALSRIKNKLSFLKKENKE